MALTKDQLLRMTEEQTRTVNIEGFGEVVIRRIKLSERDSLLKGRKPTDGQSYEEAARTGVKLVAMGLLEPRVTEEEIMDLPAAFVDKVAKEIMDFNGWTREGQAALADQFRTPS